MLKAYAGHWGLVTGDSSGIGAEFARQLAARGMHCVPFPWPVRDTERSDSLLLLIGSVHGFRVPLVIATITIVPLDKVIDGHALRTNRPEAALASELAPLTDMHPFGIAEILAGRERLRAVLPKGAESRGRGSAGRSTGCSRATDTAFATRRSAACSTARGSRREAVRPLMATRGPGQADPWNPARAGIRGSPISRSCTQSTRMPSSPCGRARR